jgi:DNA polymerase III alpha subunit
VKCGAFDWTGVERAQLFSEIDGALAAAASSAHRDRASGSSRCSTTSPFRRRRPKASKTGLANVTPWSSAEKLGFEKELLGFTSPAIPLDDYRPALESSKFVSDRQARRRGRQEHADDRRRAHFGGEEVHEEGQQAVRRRDARRPHRVAGDDDLERDLHQSQAHLVQGNIVSITGRLDQRDEAPRLVANEVKALKKPPKPAGDSPRRRAVRCGCAPGGSFR